MENIVDAVTPRTHKVKLTIGNFTVSELTIRKTAEITRISKDIVAALPVEMRGRFIELVSALGGKMPVISAIILSDKGIPDDALIERCADMTLEDLEKIANAVAHTNDIGKLAEGFRAAVAKLFVIKTVSPSPAR
jgi:hypothetical protein